MIPDIPCLQEALFHTAHNASSHFGTDKTYAALQDSHYWPNMQKHLKKYYIPSCPNCQQNKSSTRKPISPLHPLPIPDQRGNLVAINFIRPLPKDGHYNSIITFMDHLGSDLQIVPLKTTLTAEEVAELFFDCWCCENGLPLEIISDQDRLFVSRFWRALHTPTGVRLGMSTSYHPEMDGSSEHSNKTVIQAIHFHIEQNQTGWVCALPRICFDIMNTVNKSTGFSPFQLHLGQTPRILPPLLMTDGTIPTLSELSVERVTLCR